MAENRQLLEQDILEMNNEIAANGGKITIEVADRLYLAQSNGIGHFIEGIIFEDTDQALANMRGTLNESFPQITGNPVNQLVMMLVKTGPQTAGLFVTMLDEGAIVPKSILDTVLNIGDSGTVTGRVEGGQTFLDVVNGERLLAELKGSLGAGFVMGDHLEQQLTALESSMRDTYGAVTFIDDFIEEDQIKPDTKPGKYILGASTVDLGEESSDDDGSIDEYTIASTPVEIVEIGENGEITKRYTVLEADISTFHVVNAKAYSQFRVLEDGSIQILPFNVDKTYIRLNVLEPLKALIATERERIDLLEEAMTQAQQDIEDNTGLAQTAKERADAGYNLAAEAKDKAEQGIADAKTALDAANAAAQLAQKGVDDAKAAHDAATAAGDKGQQGVDDAKDALDAANAAADLAQKGVDDAKAAYDKTVENRELIDQILGRKDITASRKPNIIDHPEDALNNWDGRQWHFKTTLTGVGGPRKVRVASYDWNIEIGNWYDDPASQLIQPYGVRSVSLDLNRGSALIIVMTDDTINTTGEEIDSIRWQVSGTSLNDTEESVPDVVGAPTASIPTPSAANLFSGGTHLSPVFDWMNTSLPAGSYTVTVTVTAGGQEFTDTHVVEQPVMLKDVAFVNGIGVGEPTVLDLTYNISPIENHYDSDISIVYADGRTENYYFPEIVNVTWMVYEGSTEIAYMSESDPTYDASELSELITESSHLIAPHFDLSAYSGKRLRIEVELDGSQGERGSASYTYDVP
ncbi:MAG: hypothetical protein AAF639_33095 [Chloroflexota bacterium]